MNESIEFSQSADLIPTVLSDPFSFWQCEAPSLPLIARDILAPITAYDAMLISEWRTGKRQPDYNFAAHDLLVNTFCFYMKGAAK